MIRFDASDHFNVEGVAALPWLMIASARRSVFANAANAEEAATLIAILGLDGEEPIVVERGPEPPVVHGRFTVRNSESDRSRTYYRCTRCPRVGQASGSTPVWPICSDCHYVLSDEELEKWSA